MQLPDKIVLNECLPRHVHHSRVKMGKNDLFDAAQAAHEKFPLRHGIEQRHRRAEDERIRVRIKAHGRRRDAEFLCPLAGFIQ